jgi:hypothetical protein
MRGGCGQLCLTCPVRSRPARTSAAVVAEPRPLLPGNPHTCLQTEPALGNREAGAPLE